MEKRIIQVEEKVPVKLLIPLSIQHMFAMFGASVLVPFLFGISPAIVLFMNGIGTLLFIAITKGKAPAYLGSSFAFLAPASIVIQNFGYEYALGGFVAVGFCGCILALIIYKFGTDWINIVLPPAAMGPVVALIGLELSANAASNAGLLDENIDPRKIIVFMVTLGVAVFGSILFRKFLAVIPILIAVLAGYAAAIICGIVDFEEVAAAKIIAMPHFSSPKFDAQAIMIILPVILVIISEHIGHQVVTSKIVGRDLLKDPGLHRSLFADNFSTMLSGMIGSVPTTTYGENIGVMAVTGVYSVRVIAGAAILSIICSFVGKLSALIMMTARTGPPAITPVPGAAGFIRTSPAPNFPTISCGMLVPFSGIWMRFFLASSMPLRIASGTSPDLPRPKPTIPFPSPTTTSAANFMIRPPFTVLDTRLMETTFSASSSPCGSILAKVIPPLF